MKIDVPDAEQGHQRRQVGGERCRGEMFIHLGRAGEELREARRSDRQHQGQADWRPQGEAPAGPVPDRQDVVRGYPEFERRSAIAGHRDEVALQRRALRQPRRQPGARGTRIDHRLLRGEALRGGHEQRSLRVAALEHAVQLRGIDVGDEVEGERGVAKAVEGVQRQTRTQIGAAHAHVHDVRDGLAGGAPARTRAQPGGQTPHVLERIAYFGRRRRAAPQRHVQGGTLLGRIDQGARIHAIAPAAPVLLRGQPLEQLHGFGVELVAREIQLQARARDAQPLGARRIGGQQRRQRGAVQRLRMCLQGAPGAGLGQGVHGLRSGKMLRMRGGKANDRGEIRIGLSVPGGTAGNARPCRRGGPRRRA